MALMDVAETGNMALFRCRQDPRNISFPIGNIPRPSGPPLERTLTSTVNEGHYMIYLYGNHGCIHPRTPTLNVVFQTIGLRILSLFGRSSLSLNSSGGAVPRRRPARLPRAAHQLV